jgi:hypothetical protein
VRVPNHQRRLGSHHLLQYPFEFARTWIHSDTEFPATNADLGAAAGLDLTPLLVDGTMNVILSPSEARQRKRRAPALMAGVPLCQ